MLEDPDSWWRWVEDESGPTVRVVHHEWSPSSWVQLEWVPHTAQKGRRANCGLIATWHFPNRLHLLNRERERETERERGEWGVFPIF